MPERIRGKTILSLDLETQKPPSLVPHIPLVAELKILYFIRTKLLGTAIFNSCHVFSWESCLQTFLCVRGYLHKSNRENIFIKAICYQILKIFDNYSGPGGDSSRKGRVPSLKCFMEMYK